MVSVLPFWPAVYNKLAIDTDHRIRELTHTALKAVVTVSLEIYLKTNDCISAR